MKRLLLILTLAIFTSAITVNTLSADPVGDTYTIGLSGYGSDPNDDKYMNAQNTFSVQTFDGSGTAKVIGESLFGEKGTGGELLDEFVLTEFFSSPTAETRQVRIEVVARDKSTLALRNWVADGEEFSSLNPFSDTEVAIGDFNGGTNRLAPGAFGQLISARYMMIGTDGMTYGPVSGSFAIDSPEVGGELGGLGFFSVFPNDIATFEIASGVEVAGYQLTYVYSVPEPGVFGVLTLWFSSAGLIRRRSSSRKF